MHIFKRFVFLFAFSLLPLVSSADPLELTLTQGVSSAIPIAIVPFAGQNDPNDPSNISSVITADLQNSGQFNTLSAQSMGQTPHAVGNVDANYWQHQKVNAVVVGNVIPVGNNQYKVNFALVNVYAGANQQQTGNQLLTQQDFTVPGDQLRALAHHISDIVYQQLTGVRGVFSTRIAYVLVQRSPGSTRYSLNVADIDGYNPRPLLSSSQPIMSPSWSHDGKKIAYVSFESVTPKIYIHDVTTGNRQVLSGFPGINGAPAWSPDDSKLAIVLSKSGNPKIYVMNVDGSAIRELTTGTSIDTEPSWSPDGKSLIFTSDRGGGPQIYQLNLADNSIQRLTYSGSYNARGEYTPDGGSIVMIHRAGTEQYGIAIQDLQSGTVQVLSQSGFDSSPSVAPNGRMVLYESDAGNEGVLGMVSIDGKVHLRIPAAVGSVQDPAWSPFLS